MKIVVTRTVTVTTEYDPLESGFNSVDEAVAYEKGLGFSDSLEQIVQAIEFNEDPDRIQHGLSVTTKE